MPELVTVSLRDDVAVVTIDNPPVNALDLEARTALAAALARLEEDGAVEAVVITGAGRTFVAGADIRELERAVWDHAVEPPDFHELLRLVEDFRRPVVMAVNGTALGGGLELAMAGHYRVAASAARLGMPEVNLGIIPGAEGTQRLDSPRRSGEGARDVRVGKAHRCRGCGKVRARGPHCRRGLRGRRRELRPRHGAAWSTASADTRADRQARRFRGPRRRLRRGPRKGAEDAPPPDSAPRRHRRDRGRDHAALRRRVPPRTCALAHVRTVRAGARHGARLPRRA